MARSTDCQQTKYVNKNTHKHTKYVSVHTGIYYCKEEVSLSCFMIIHTAATLQNNR